MSERRGHWYLITAIILGIAAGLVTTWGLFPVPPQAASPASLRADFKDEYRYMISAAYAATNNLGRARARLALLEDADMIRALNDQAEQMRANNIVPNVVRNVSDLSLALQADSPPTETATTAPLEQPSSTAIGETSPPAALTPFPETATPQPNIETATLESVSTSETIPSPLPTSTPEATSTSQPTSIPTTAPPRATIAPTFTAGPPFSITKQTPFCEPAQAGLLQITLKDSNNRPAAGIELTITWAGGEERFFSGLKPELGNGYADFTMTPDIEYNLSLSNGATRVTGLKSIACSAKDGSNSFGGIRLDFKQP